MSSEFNITRLLLFFKQIFGIPKITNSTHKRCKHLFVRLYTGNDTGRGKDDP
ncbi:33989_t:CDS:1, partial [Racocetra persica]